MIDHVSVGVADLERALHFYEAAFAPLGLKKLIVRPGTIGFGKDYPEFWINLRAGMVPVPTESGTHICLRARGAAQIDAFHTAALKAAVAPTARRVRARNIIRATMRRSPSIRTATASRW